MGYRTILVQVDDSKAGQARASRALALASRFGAAVTAVFLRSDIIPPFMTGDGFAITPGEIIQQFVDERAKEAARLSAAARSAIEASARAASVAFTWRDINGDNEDELIACARRHDLAILPATMKPALAQSTLTAAHVGMASGAPVLVMPNDADVPTLGRRVLVAWKEAREAARAINDAWPFLQEAETVTLLSVSKSSGKTLDPMLKAQLDGHGCRNVSLIVDADVDAPTGDVIRRHIGRTDADLIVLGLFGHSRLQEFVLGGVSRNLLAEPPIPMLVSH